MNGNDAVNQTTTKTFSALNKRLLRAFTEQLQRSLCQRDNFTFSVFAFFIIRFDVLVGDSLDHLYYVFRFGDQANKLFVLRLKQLEQRPYGNVLESGVTTR